MRKISIFWFRRDLRLDDNAGFYHALKVDVPVLPIFIFDENILEELPKNDARVTFIHQEVAALKSDLEKLGSSLLIEFGKPIEIWQKVIQNYQIERVFTNHDFEPYALKRDSEIQELLKSENIEFKTYKDHVIFEKDEVLKKDGTPYLVFTPYSRKWKEKLTTQIASFKNSDGTTASISYFLKPYPNKKYFHNLLKINLLKDISLSDMGFEPSRITFPSTTVARGLIKTYEATRNFPGIEGTSKLGLHFRFGTISIREKAMKAKGLSETYLNELIWRDFYAMIMANFPHVIGNAFRKKYDAVQWRNNEEEFKLWCAGKTGYPIVDAGMRELNQTGFMHNRVRMVVASFLTKHLLIDWRWGEAYFAEKLLDFDLASNNGGWQWAAGCGTDAAPYFRIFNPESQQKKFDKELKYIKKWVPEYGTEEYSSPIVDHKFARERCLATYKKALG